MLASACKPSNGTFCYQLLNTGMRLTGGPISTEMDRKLQNFTVNIQIKAKTQRNVTLKE